RWNAVPSIKPDFASFLKFSTVFGATSGQNSATISPSLVLITATSFLSFIGIVSFFSGVVSFLSSPRRGVPPRANPIMQQNNVSFIFDQWHECATLSRSLRHKNIGKVWVTGAVAITPVASDSSGGPTKKGVQIMKNQKTLAAIGVFLILPALVLCLSGLLKFDL